MELSDDDLVWIHASWECAVWYGRPGYYHLTHMFRDKSELEAAHEITLVMRRIEKYLKEKKRLS